MKHLIMVLALTAGVASCARTETYPLGTDVTVQRNDGTMVSGRLIEVKSDRLVVQRRDGGNTEVLKSQITSLKAMTTAAEPTPTAEAKPAEAPVSSPPVAPAVPPAAAEATPPPASAATSLSPSKPRPAAGARASSNNSRPVDTAPSHEAPAPAAVATTEAKEATPPPLPLAPPPPEPEYRELTIHAGTTLSATLATPVASDTSKVEDVVRATLKSAVSIDGIELMPTGATIIGHVTKAEQAAKVKGRALIAFRFNSVELPGGPERMSTETITREAASTKGKDATKIGIGAGAGAIIGGIVGGGGGAATGAAIGGGAGTATVLATRGDEVSLTAGTPVTVTLTAPLTIRVQVK